MYNVSEVNELACIAGLYICCDGAVRLVGACNLVTGMHISAEVQKFDLMIILLYVLYLLCLFCTMLSQNDTL